MGNPRQRRKQKSSDNKVRQSRRSEKLLKKMPRLSAPAAILQAWDKTLTVKQNYAKLGLASNLDMHSSGGYIKPTVAPVPSTSAAVEEIPKGKAKIVRDEAGNVLQVIFSTHDQKSLDGENEQPRQTAWGTLEQSVPVQTLPLGFAFKNDAPLPETETVKALERLASTSTAVKRHSSSLEKVWLAEMVRLHGSDVQKMARDLELNVWQKTSGQIGKMIRKAGGFAKLAPGAQEVEMDL